MNNSFLMSIYQIAIVLLVIHPVLLFFFAEIRNIAGEDSSEEAKKNAAAKWNSRQRVSVV